MDELPLELLDLILEQCEHSALKNLRVANRRYSNAATPRVFEHFYMGFFSECLDNLIALSKSPLAKHVKRFTFFTDFLPSYSSHKTPEDRNDWESMVDYRPEFEAWRTGRELSFGREGAGERWWRSATRRSDYDSPEDAPRHQLTHKELDRGFGEFCWLRNQQACWTVDMENVWFKEHFARFPNLVEATCAPTAFVFEGKTKYAPVWRRLRRRMLVSPDDWNDLAEREEYYPRKSELKYVEAPICLLEAIGFRASFAGTRHISKLTIKFSHYIPLRSSMGGLASSPDWPRPVLLDNQTRFNFIIEGFRYLIDVNLSMQDAGQYSQHDPHGEAAVEEVIEFLQRARHLKRLTLAYGEDDSHSIGLALFRLQSSPLPLAPLFINTPPWPQLEHLSLSAVVSKPILLHFLKNLSPTLRSLELRNMVVDEPNDLIYQVPRILVLHHVYLYRLEYQEVDPELFSLAFREGSDVAKPYEQGVKAYLLGKSFECPQLDMGVPEGE